MVKDKQLARLIFHNILATMKDTLNLEELSYREVGRDDPRYKTFKKHLMEFTYNNLRNLLDELEEWGFIIKTENHEDVKNGYQDSLSGGSGYINSDDLMDFVEKEEYNRND